MGSNISKLEPNNSKFGTEPITCLTAELKGTGITGNC